MSAFIRRFRPSFWASVFALPLIALMLGLGVWQLYRLDWKLELLDRIDTRVHAEPVPLPTGAIDPDEWEYRNVTVTGTFEHDKEIHLLANKGAGYVGYEVITPLERPDGSPVLVDRGWVPTEKKDPDTRAEGQVAGERTITGIVRMSQEKPWAVPANRPEEGIWFYANIPEMEKYLGMNVAPVFVQADDTPNPGGWPEGGQTEIDIPNNHLGYAITWFGLAIALAVIYVVYHLRREDAE